MSVTKDELLSWLGKTKTAARRTVSAYLKTMPLDVRVQDPKLQGLCQFHPTRKFPESGTAFVLSAGPPYYTKALYVEARSGGLVDFSWIKCIENLYGKYTKAKDVRANTLAALRNEAFRSEAIQTARKRLGSVCARCTKRCSRLVVDHDVKPFVQILDEFLEQNGVALTDLKIRGSKDGFRLRSLGRQWRAFHDANATLVGLCSKCNGSLNSRGYRARFH
jgi:hypothetical protein